MLLPVVQLAPIGSHESEQEKVDLAPDRDGAVVMMSLMMKLGTPGAPKAIMIAKN